MHIYVDIRGFLEIHVWICHGFSDQGCYHVKTVKIVIVRKSSKNILFSKRHFWRIPAFAVHSIPDLLINEMVHLLRSSSYRRLPNRKMRKQLA